MSLKSDAELLNLLNYLEEEFQGIPGVRARIRQLATTTRSIDLPQDYDPEANDLHRAKGVVVTAFSREYFFPLEWASGRNTAAVNANIEEIRDYLDYSF
jgi:hypothetical protein